MEFETKMIYDLIYLYNFFGRLLFFLFYRFFQDFARPHDFLEPCVMMWEKSMLEARLTTIKDIIKS